MIILDNLIHHCRGALIFSICFLCELFLDTCHFAYYGKGLRNSNAFAFAIRFPFHRHNSLDDTRFHDPSVWLRNFIITRSLLLVALKFCRFRIRFTYWGFDKSGILPELCSQSDFLRVPDIIVRHHWASMKMQQFKVNIL